MRIQSNNPNFIMPIRGTQGAGAWDIYMPEAGMVDALPQMVDLGFSAAVPPGYAALLLPRSSTGAKYGLELNNTVGLIDSDYRDNWKAKLKTKDGLSYTWARGDRLLQFIVVPYYMADLERVDSLEETDRAGGFGSTGA